MCDPIHVKHPERASPDRTWTTAPGLGDPGEQMVTNSSHGR